jgi:hypothetical protein
VLALTLAAANLYRDNLVKDTSRNLPKDNEKDDGSNPATTCKS